MSKEVYDGLGLEVVLFEDDIATELSYPEGYSGCEVSTVEVYSKDQYGVPVPIGQCDYEDEDEIIFNWGSFGKRRT